MFQNKTCQIILLQLSLVLKLPCALIFLVFNFPVSCCRILLKSKEWGLSTKEGRREWYQWIPFDFVHNRRCFLGALKGPKKVESFLMWIVLPKTQKHIMTSTYSSYDNTPPAATAPVMTVDIELLIFKITFVSLLSLVAHGHSYTLFYPCCYIYGGRRGSTVLVSFYKIS
jgi:hypothetical protein